MVSRYSAITLSLQAILKIHSVSPHCRLIEGNGSACSIHCSITPKTKHHFDHISLFISSPFRSKIRRWVVSSKKVLQWRVWYDFGEHKLVSMYWQQNPRVRLTTFKDRAQCTFWISLEFAGRTIINASGKSRRAFRAWHFQPMLHQPDLLISDKYNLLMSSF